MKKYELKCKLCGEVIPWGHCQQGGMHINCASEQIRVFKIALKDNPKTAFVENRANRVVDFIDQADVGEDEFIIKTEWMAAGMFYNMPEFDGF